VLLYGVGHVPGAQRIDWHQDLNDHVVRDYVDRAQFEALVRRLGIDASHTVVFYGDKNNWWATYAFWVFRLFGFDNLRVMDGGRTKWEQEGRPMTEDVPAYPPTTYVAPERDDRAIRAFMDDARRHMAAGAAEGKKLIDVRSAPEFTGERTHMPDYPQEGTLRGGHIPGARNVPWARAANADGTFRAPTSCARSTRARRARPGVDVIAYCRIGERSSHTCSCSPTCSATTVRNYDGSWTEWGNAVRAPIESAGPAGGAA
jgi:thiosulfate/3-mercaptopyruvate sulfurtransferase